MLVVPLSFVEILFVLIIGILIVRNILLAAESLGLGAVWTAAYPYRDRIQSIRTFVSMPGRVLPLCIIPIGYPSTEVKPKQKFDEKKIHYNGW